MRAPINKWGVFGIFSLIITRNHTMTSPSSIVRRIVARSLTSTTARAFSSSSFSSSSSSSSNDDGVRGGEVNKNNTNRTNKNATAPANVSASAADRRLAGRRRFYADVGIVPTSPLPSLAHNRQSTTMTSSSFVDSPISAGVDGTDSASGVTNIAPERSRWASMLVPPPPRHHRHRRRPGVGDDAHDGPESHSSSSSSSSSSSNWYGVTLDGRTLRTPLGHPLSLPSLSLAIAVGTEWDAQLTHLRPAQMPLMTLCCTAIDQVASNPNAHRNDVLSYMNNDTTCYVADPADPSDRGLYRRQSKIFAGLHDHCTTEIFGLPYGHDLRPAIAYGEGEALAFVRRRPNGDNGGGGSRGGLGGGSGLPHPPLLISRAIKYVDSLDAWTLAALYSACAESKSFFIGAALIHEAMTGRDGLGGRGGVVGGGGGVGVGGGAVVHAGGKGGGGRGHGEYDGDDDDASSKSTRVDDDVIRDGRWASDAARVEEEFNIECWGLVEGGHDYDRLNCSIQMHAASFLARAVARG
jgi:ATP synthase F1 complex assembly factor 2